MQYISGSGAGAEAISQLNETVGSVQRYCNPGVNIIRHRFIRPIFRSDVVVEEAQANRQDIFDYADKSTVLEDYRAFIEEFLKGVNE